MQHAEGRRRFRYRYESQGFKRPDGMLSVRCRRSGVEPSGGCLVGLPVWAYTRLRWQFRAPRTWSVEIWAPSRHRSLLNRKVHSVTVESRGEAIELAQELTFRVEDGEFDHYLQR